MKTSFYYILIFLFLVILPGCEEDEESNYTTVTGAGPVVTKTLDLQSFNKILLAGVADFNIHIGTPQSVVLNAQQNIIDVMTCKVEDQTLKVGLMENISIEGHDGIRFDVTVPAISNINLTGVGDFELAGADQSELTVTVTGVGDIKAYEMKVNSCNIVITGVGNCQVNVITGLIAKITGIGNIFYKGNPSISSSITGSGKIINSN